MKTNKSAKVSHKLAFAFGIILVLLVAICAITSLRITAINHRVATIRAQVANGDLVQAVWKAESDSARFQRNAVIMAGKDAQGAAKLFDESDKHSASVDRLLEKIRNNPSTPKAAELLAGVKKAKDAFAPLRNESNRLARAGDLDGATAHIFGKMRPANKAYFDALDALDAENAAIIEASAQAVTVEGQRAVYTTVGCSAAAALICIVLGLKIGRTIYADLGGEPAAVVAAANRLAAGDLTVDIHLDSKDRVSILAALRTMQERLSDLLGQVRDSSHNVALGSKEIAIGNSDLSQRTEIQASNLQQAVGSMNQLTTQIANSLDTAERADQLAAGASDAAKQGGELMTQVVATMERIAASSKQIADITGVIDSIAFQTNILALNAAVEAARAGDQGRGFAVVAGEVRTLAQRSALAARQIKTLIGTSVDEVATGARSVNVAGSSMSAIVSKVQSVSDLITEISSATREQSQSIGQFGTSIEQLEQMTQQNAALVEQSAAAAESLRNQSARLAEMVEVFKFTASDDESAAVLALRH